MSTTTFNGIKYTYFGTFSNAVAVVTTEQSPSLFFADIPQVIMVLGTPYTVTHIAENAFQGCTQLFSVTIPISVTSIGTNAFPGATTLLGEPYTPLIISSYYHQNNTVTVNLFEPKTVTNYSYSTDGTNYTALSPVQTTSPLTINVSSNSSIRIKGIGGNRTVSGYTITIEQLASSPFTPKTLANMVATKVSMSTILANFTSAEIKAQYTATQLKAAGYTQQNITVAGYTQTTIPSLTNFSDLSKTVADGSFNIVAPSSNSSGGFSYTSSDPTVATVSGSTVTLLTGGTTVITALQAETATYYGGSISCTLTVVAKVVSSLAIGTIGAKTYGDIPFQIPVTTNSTGGITYSSSNSSVVTISSSGLVTIVGAGTTVLTVVQLTDGSYFEKTVTSELTVGNASVSLSISGISGKTYGDSPFQITTSSSSTGAVASTGSISYTSSNQGVATVSETGLVTIVGAGSIVITALQGAIQNYNSGSTTSELTVGNASVSLSMSEISGKTYGDVPFQITVSSSSTGSISYTSSNSSIATVSETGLVTVLSAGSTTITATQVATTNYNGGSTTGELTVNPSSASNPVVITGGSGLSYFLTTSAGYASLSSDIVLPGGSLKSSNKKVIKGSKRLTIKRG